jgi:hypothetical protein
MAGSRSTRKGKPKGVYTEKRLAGIAPYNWKPGAPSPNPGGRPRQHKEMVAELRSHAPMIKDAILALVLKGLEGKLTTSDKYLSAHLWELWQAMYGRHAQSVLLTGGLDVGDNPNAPENMGGLTALLRSAQREKPAPAPAPAPSNPALTPEEREITGLQIMLAQVRADTGDGNVSDREVLASLVGEERAAELIGEAVIVVDASGAAVAPPPAAAKPAAAWQDKPLAEAPASAASAEGPVQEEAPASSGLDEASPSPPPFTPPPPPPRQSTREPRRPSGFPEFDRFSAELARTKQADEERARKVEQARAEGRPQISAAEAFPPDPREPPEVVRFTLAPGGRIRRVAG